VIVMEYRKLEEDSRTSNPTYEEIEKNVLFSCQTSLRTKAHTVIMSRRHFVCYTLHLTCKFCNMGILSFRYFFYYVKVPVKTLNRIDCA